MTMFSIFDLPPTRIDLIEAYCTSGYWQSIKSAIMYDHEGSRQQCRGQYPAKHAKSDNILDVNRMQASAARFGSCPDRR
ncbi:hypothetical protein [uncultured Thalassospira sp.]|jgi:hypothetical protein|uniref:hypothetical protein n=1 Tax=uncultured Thalassospira sp. TaxID=404382 RepID=UPI0030D7B3E4|tara:strand:- start:4906 stop:5142 length:237 start_codon:yes stop_codon:yes gene_type:complete